MESLGSELRNRMRINFDAEPDPGSALEKMDPDPCCLF